MFLFALLHPPINRAGGLRDYLIDDKYGSTRGTTCDTSYAKYDATHGIISCTICDAIFGSIPVPNHLWYQTNDGT